MPLKFKKIFPLPIVLLVLIGCESGRSGPDLSEVFGQAEEMENLKSLIVYKDGDILREGYYHGGHADSLHDVRSVTKSVMATLVGIAIDRSVISSENQKLGVLLSSLAESMDSAKADITLAQVLSMTSGLDGNELADAFEYNNWVNAPDQLTYTINKTLVHTPGTYFAYSSGVAHLTSAILTQTTGWSTLQYAMQHLFTPMGIGWPKWSTDKRGIYNGGAGLKITPQDMLKIGKLYLNNGRFNGERILSESWIEKATTIQIALSSNIMSFAQGYGYYWWIGNINSRDYFFANGWGGQFIVVVPELELIVVATNHWSGVSTATAQQQWYDTMNLIMNEIVAAY